MFNVKSICFNTIISPHFAIFGIFQKLKPNLQDNLIVNFPLI